MFLVSFDLHVIYHCHDFDPYNRLNYGLDYKGNLCGDKHGNPDLRQLQLRYWLNPDQVYQSGLKNSQFKLPDARTICLMDCPIPAEDSLNWVCDYPEGGDIRFSIDNWINRKYDYFADLTPEQRNTSLQLQGPCYPVIFPTVNGKLRVIFCMKCIDGYYSFQLVTVSPFHFKVQQVYNRLDLSVFVSSSKTVYWSCQFIARASNTSLLHWQQLGGVSIDEDILIDESIHRSINSRSSVLKVEYPF